MEKIFTINVGQMVVDSIGQNYSNDFGQWCVVAKSERGRIAGVISLSPAPAVFDLDLSKIAAKVEFKNTFGVSSLNKIAVATKDPELPCFHFAAEGFQIGNSVYEIKVEIDASKAEIKDRFKSSVDHSKEMFETGKLADISIIAGKKMIMAHNFILSRSPIFYAMLNEHDTKEAQEKVIKIEDIEYEVLVEMIRFMYTDQIPKIKEMACALLVAANKYDLPGLANECGNYLIKNVGIESFVDVWIVAEKLVLPQLRASAIEFFMKNRNAVISSDVWKQLKDDNWKLVIEILELCSPADS